MDFILFYGRVIGEYHSGKGMTNFNIKSIYINKRQFFVAQDRVKLGLSYHY